MFAHLLNNLTHWTRKSKYLEQVTSVVFSALVSCFELAWNGGERMENGEEQRGKGLVQIESIHQRQTSLSTKSLIQQLPLSVGQYIALDVNRHILECPLQTGKNDIQVVGQMNRIMSIEWKKIVEIPKQPAILVDGAHEDGDAVGVDTKEIISENLEFGGDAGTSSGLQPTPFLLRHEWNIQIAAMREVKENEKPGTTMR